MLIPALRNSDSIVTARISGKLVGIGNALSDGYLVVYYPHMLVHPDHHGKGIGRAMMECLQQKYVSFHQQILVADGNAIEFYKRMGFQRAGKTESMWIYSGRLSALLLLKLFHLWAESRSCDALSVVYGS